MARKLSMGYELNSTASNVEYANSQNVAIQTSVVRSGTYSGYMSSGSSYGAFNSYQLFSANTQGVLYARVYVRFEAFPPSSDIESIFGFQTSSGAHMHIRVKSDGKLQLYNKEDSAQVGSDSSALSLNTWYRVEVKVDTTTLASTSVEARVDGSSFASGTVNLAAGPRDLIWGVIDATAGSAFKAYFDDFAVNDDSGSFQNSWPGEEEIIHLRPNATGDGAQWRPLGGNNWENVDEVTPDDDTSWIDTEARTLNDTDDYNLSATPAAMDSSDTINVVQVGVRYRGSSSSANDSFVVRIKASASGTVEESSNIQPTSTSYVTNANAAPRNHPLTLYDLPGASTTAWTKTDLDSSQVGVKFSVSDSNQARVSTLWVLVGHKPAAGGGGATVSISRRMLMGLGV